MQEQDNSISIEESPSFLSEMLGKCLREIRKVIVYMSSHIDMPLN